MQDLAQLIASGLTFGAICVLMGADFGIISSAGNVINAASSEFLKLAAW